MLSMRHRIRLLATGLALALTLLGARALAGEPIELFDGEPAEAEADAGATPAPSTDSPDGGVSETEGPVIERTGSSASEPGPVPGRSQRTFSLDFERRGNSIFVRGSVEGRRVYFLFDTGATYTTLTPSIARKVGASPDKDAPTMRLRTANGTRSARVGIVARLMVGDQLHQGVSFTVCESCGGSRYRGAPVAGLLGLNVLRRYRYEIDSEAGRIEMAPAGDFDDRSADVRPWFTIDEIDVTIEQAVDKDAGTVAFTVRNRSDRRIDEATVVVDCKGSEETVSFSLGAGAEDRHEATLPDDDCRRPRLRLRSARW
jgi:clan AA aspartic protease (TIGR02281 family)